MEEAGEDTARQIEKEKPHVSHGVLDVVAEDPEEQHVAGEVHDVGVQEHIGK